MCKKKSILFAVALLLFTLPALAQGGKKALEIGEQALRSTLATGVEREIAEQTLGKLPTFYRTEIRNFAASPIVKIAPNPITAMDLLPSVNSRYAADVLLKSGILQSKKMYKLLGGSQEIYLPRSFALTSRQEIYRGASIFRWEDLETILKEGIKAPKTQGGEGIYATSDLSLATISSKPRFLLEHGVPEEFTSVSLLVRIKPTDQFLRDNLKHHSESQWLFSNDIPASMIPDVLIFLKMRGERGWYKAQLEGDEVVLIGVPSINVPYMPVK